MAIIKENIIMAIDEDFVPFIKEYSSWTILQMVTFFSWVIKNIISSSKYQGDGHYLINSRELFYYVHSDQKDKDVLDYELYDDCDSNNYIPSIDVDDNIFINDCATWAPYFAIGITIKHGLPRHIVYHGTWFQNLDPEGEHSHFNDFNPDAQQVMDDLESYLLRRPSWLDDCRNVMERACTDSVGWNIPSFVIDMRYPPKLFQFCMDNFYSSDVLESGKEVERKDLDDWKEQVKDRDNVCIVCGSEKHLVCHHVYPFKLYPDLRDDVNNGVVFCKWCHNKYHSYYGKGENINPSSLVEFVQRFGTMFSKRE